MKISKLIAIDENGQEISFNVKEGIGLFVTEDNQQLTLSTQNEILNMLMMRQILSSPPTFK